VLGREAGGAVVGRQPPVGYWTGLRLLNLDKWIVASPRSGLESSEAEVDFAAEVTEAVEAAEIAASVDDWEFVVETWRGCCFQ